MAMPTQARVEKQFNFDRETGERYFCSVEGCDKWSRFKGMCGMHYGRVRKHGDPNVGQVKTPHGAVGSFVANTLEYEGDECILWPFSKTAAGYGYFRGGIVTRYICEVHNGPPPAAKLEAAHSCGKGHLGCVTKKHLSWKTPKENAADKVLHGTHNKGERHWNAKFTAEQVKEIRKLLKTMRPFEIAARYGVPKNTIYSISTGISWKSLPEEAA